MGRLERRRTVFTGAAGGIGDGIAVRFTGETAKVVLTGPTILVDRALIASRRRGHGAFEGTAQP
jgi:NAD(P)-dependent dehydrogenase (short-subunit alcohol dehydrogenase family)